MALCRVLLLLLAPWFVALIAPRAAPAQPPPAQGSQVFRTLSATDGATCGITTTGALFCWGANFFGHQRAGPPQRGDLCGTTDCRLSPVPLLPGATVVSASVTGGSANPPFICVVYDGGRGACWGDHSVGQLGSGGSPNGVRTPATLAVEPQNITGGLLFARVSTGSDHACGLTTTEDAYCWGNGNDGQLGAGPVRQRCLFDCSSVPLLVQGGLQFRAVYAGDRYSCGLTVAGAAYCWGRNTSGRLGRGEGGNSGVPVAVSGGLNFSALSLGDAHVCGLTTAGAAYCWGRGDEGQLGTGRVVSSRVPVAVAGDVTFQSIAAGTRYSCGVAADGAAYCWGKGDDGRLGTPTLANQPSPARVAGDGPYLAIVAGSNHTCASARSGGVFCWGKGGWGNLGTGTRTDSPTPVRVALP